MVYWMARSKHEDVACIIIYIAVILCLLGIGIGLSAAHDAAQAIVSLFMTLTILCGCLYVSSDNIPVLISWFDNISWLGIAICVFTDSKFDGFDMVIQLDKQYEQFLIPCKVNKQPMHK